MRVPIETTIRLPPTVIPALDGEPAWRSVLRRAGWPTDVVVLDFETAFDADYSLKKMSTVEYVHDPRFQVIGCAIAAEFAAPFFERDPKAFLRQIDLENRTVVAQNAAFDGGILAWHYNMHPPYVLDLLGLARADEPRRANDLDAMAERERLPRKGDTKQFEGKRAENMTPEDWKAMEEYACRDAWLEMQLLYRLLPRLTRPEIELPLMRHTLGMFWKPRLRVNQKRAGLVAARMHAEVDKALAPLGLSREEVSGNKSFEKHVAAALDVAGEKIDGYTKRTKTGKVQLAIAKGDKGLDALKNHASERVRQLVAARTAVKSWPLHIARIQGIVEQAKPLGAVPILLKYCGAHTGRWSGGEGVNPQNLPSRGLELAREVRTILEAPEGTSLVIADASAVEARGLAWLAGQDDLCQLFRDFDSGSGQDVYCTYAARMCHAPIRRSRENDPPAIAEYLNRMRAMGKVQVLGCGYGMGWEKCVAFAKTVYGIDLTEAEARDLVESYRKSVPKITRLWRIVEQKFRAAARYGEASEFEGKLKFHKHHDVTFITLPSGRDLRYHGVRLSIINGREQMWMPHPYATGDARKRIYLWGGTLVENIVQALCRDMLGESLLRAEKNGIPIVLHAHDELVGLAPETQAKESLAGLIKIMSTPPEWGLSMPIAAEGKVSKCYTK